jgi:hypothetical protein
MSLATILGSRRLAAAAATLSLAAGLAAAAAPASAAPELFLRANGASGAGWQAAAPVSIPAGQGSLFIHYACPGNLIVDSGAYTANSVGQTAQFAVGFNGPRLDESPAYFGEWGWTFAFPGGAPSGLVITFDIHCVKK